MMVCLNDRLMEFPARGRRSAFTLIEILVVVSIIALLVAVLIPSLAAARTQTRNKVCMANLHGMAKGMIMYANDYRDRLPNGNMEGFAQDFDGATQVLTFFARRYMRDPEVFYCPQDRDPRPKQILTADYLLPDSARTSYDYYSVWWLPEYGPILTRIKDAPLVWDLEGGWPKPLDMQNHGVKGGHVGYADGHADWQPVDKWDKDNWPRPASKYYRP